MNIKDNIKLIQWMSNNEDTIQKHSDNECVGIIHKAIGVMVKPLGIKKVRTEMYPKMVKKGGSPLIAYVKGMEEKIEKQEKRIEALESELKSLKAALGGVSS